MVAGRDSWQVLSRLPAWQVLEIPRRDHNDAARVRDDRAAERGQALTAAFSAGSPVAVGWVREKTGGPVTVVCAGPAMAASETGDDVDVLAMPPGSRGRRLGDGRAGELLYVMPSWTRIAAVSDVLLAGPSGPGTFRPSLEDGLLSVWLGPFAWLLLAEPAGADTISTMAAETGRVLLGAQGFASPVAQLAARRAGSRHDELRQAASTGLWHVDLLAGAATPHDAERISGLLRASFDLGELPYALARGTPTAVPSVAGGNGRRQTSMLDDPALSWAVPARQPAPDPPAAVNPYAAPQRPGSSEQQWPAPEPEAPFWASTALVSALARVPAREVPGIRMVLQPDFDLTPETSTLTTGPGFTLGDVLDWNKVASGALSVPASSVNRHVFVCGATGSGKSQTIRHMLESATGTGIPWLVIEPAKAEYRLMATRLPGIPVVRIRPGELEDPAAGINPLEPAAGFPLQAHADLLRALFLAAFDADEPFPQVLSAALTRCYEQAGWDLVTGQPAVPGVEPSYPGLSELQATATAIVTETGYGKEVSDNVRGFVQVRLGSLRLGTAGRFLDGAHHLDFGKLADANVVLEIEDCGDDRDKAFLIGAVLIRLAEHLRVRRRLEAPGPVTLRHITVVEEAHRLLRQPPPGTGSGPATHAVEMFADLLAEIRAYGEGLVIAEQIPSKLIPDVIKNTAVKVVHRLPAADDRSAVGATMNLTDDQSRYLVTLLPGEAAVHADGMDYPLLAKMPDGTARESTGPCTPASPASLIMPRSPACPRDCAGVPCTLRQARAAQLASGRDPRITFWAEITVLAHLTGWDMPMPSREFLTELERLEPRLRDCALAHAADLAVAARVPAITSRISSPLLAAHAAEAMRAAADGQGWACADAGEPQWLAPAYLWTEILQSLQQHDHDHPGSGPHPETGRWDAAYGQAIPGRTCAEQLDFVQRRHDSAQRDQRERAMVTWGDRTPAVLEQAVGVPRGDPLWGARLTDILTDFPRCGWVADQLTTDT